MSRQPLNEHVVELPDMILHRVQRRGFDMKTWVFFFWFF